MRERLDPANIEVVDDQMAEVLRAKSSSARVAMISDMHETARLVVRCGVRQLHPAWSEPQVQLEVARRMYGDSGGLSPIRD